MAQSSSTDDSATTGAPAPSAVLVPPMADERMGAPTDDCGLGAALDDAIESLGRPFGLQAAAVYVAQDVPAGTFHLNAATNDSDLGQMRFPESLPADHPVLLSVAGASGPVPIDGSGWYPSGEPGAEATGDARSPDWFCCPLLTGNEVDGMLVLGLRAPEAPEGPSQVSALARHLATVIQLAQRAARERAKRIRLERDRQNSRDLTAIVVSASQRRDIPGIMDTITGGLAKMGYAALIAGHRQIADLEEQHHESVLAVLSVAVPNPQLLQEMERDILGRSVVGLEFAPLVGFPHPLTVAQHGPQFACIDMRELAREVPAPFDRLFSFAAGRLALDGIIVAPLKSGDRLFGTLLLAGSGLTPADLSKYGNFAQQVSVAIENAQVQAILTANTDELQADVAARAAEVSAQRERLQAVLESAGSGIVITSADGVIEYANPAWERLTGRSASSEVRRQVRIVDEETFPELFSGRYGSREVTARRPNGTSYTASVSVTPIFDKHNGVQRLSGLVVTYRDVTEYKEIDRLKSQFLSTASHQLRTPLTTILGFSELLVGRPNLSDYERQRFLRHINEHARRLKDLLDDLFDISQFESGGAIDLDPQPVQLAPTLEQEVERWQRENPGHSYFLSADGDFPPVLVDRDRFVKHVFRNLLSNATKYSPEGSSISVVVHPAGRYLEVSVTDQGIGMNKDEIKQAFDKFWRADASSTALDGTGLGLVMAKHTLELHGGQIWVESQPGSGTTVRFTLPVYGHEPTVLIVEDEEYVLEIENSILIDDGLGTITAKNGLQGIQLAKQYRPDLILLDLMMPAMSGIDVLVELKADPATANIPILVVSARTGWGSIEETYRLGAVDFVAKPFEYDELLSRVRRALEANKTQPGKRDNV